VSYTPFSNYITAFLWQACFQQVDRSFFFLLQLLVLIFHQVNLPVEIVFFAALFFFHHNLHSLPVVSFDVRSYLFFPKFFHPLSLRSESIYSLKLQLEVYLCLGIYHLIF